MREIKFRAWDRVTKGMLFPAWITRRGIEFGENGWSSNIFVLDYELMQFTGLLDKNGKEIWEGDIVSVKSQYETDEPIDTKAKVEFSNGSFRLDFHAMILNWAVLNYVSSNWLIEVIGNVFENKELLNDSKSPKTD